MSSHSNEIMKKNTIDKNYFKSLSKWRCDIKHYQWNIIKCNGVNSAWLLQRPTPYQVFHSFSNSFLVLCKLWLTICITKKRNIQQTVTWSFSWLYNKLCVCRISIKGATTMQLIGKDDFHERIINMENDFYASITNKVHDFLEKIINMVQDF